MSGGDMGYVTHVGEGVALLRAGEGGRVAHVASKGGDGGRDVGVSGDVGVEVVVIGGGSLADGGGGDGDKSRHAVGVRMQLTGLVLHGEVVFLKAQSPACEAGGDAT